MIYDLHSHSDRSDGDLAPAELLGRARLQGVGALAVTDHDTVAAYRALPREPEGITLIPGIELSTTWKSLTVHVLGLNIDPDSDAMATATRLQTEARMRRAEQIGARLARQGIEGAFEGALALAGGGFIGRPHFARHLVETGRVATMADAFDRYLGAGRAGDVRDHWAELPRVIAWIRDAGGIAVLAHPLKYKLTRTRLKRLLGDFMAAGGEGMEVVSGRQPEYRTRDLGRLCAAMGLLASLGSDFHRPGMPWAELGATGPLPSAVAPVWDRF